MRRTRNLVLALSASAALALGATAPAFADPPSNQGTDTACAVFEEKGASPDPAARAALGCAR